MDNALQQRAWRTEFDVADSEGRIVSGIAVPFNSPTQIFERGRVFSETWVKGSTAEHIQKRGDRIKVLGFHDSRTLPLGKPVGLEDRAQGMWIEARISDTQAGNEALTLVRDGVLDGFSVGFSIPEGGDTWNRDETERTITRANVHEVSLVNFPAFDLARVEAIRSAPKSISPFITSLSAGGSTMFVTFDAGRVVRDASDGSPVNPVAPHAYISLNNPMICDVCGRPEGDHADGHASTEPVEVDSTILDDLAAKRFRLQVLRAEMLRPRSLT